MKESPTSIVYRTVAELPAGATFTSISISRDLDWNDPSLVSACFAPLKADELISEVGVGPGRTITYQRTAMSPPEGRRFKSALRKPRTMNRAPGYSCPNAKHPELPRLGGEAARRPDLFGEPLTPENLGGEAKVMPPPLPEDAVGFPADEMFPDMGRIPPRQGHRGPVPGFTPGVEGVPLPKPPAPDADFLARILMEDDERLSVRLRRIADEVEAVERAIDGLAKKIGLGS